MKDRETSIRSHPVFLTPQTLTQIRDEIKLKNMINIRITLDIGISTVNVSLENEQIIYHANQPISIPKEMIEMIDQRTIYRREGELWVKWQHYDPLTDRYYKMIFVANGKPPTIEISGIKMHITKDGDPQLDTLNKLSSIQNMKGMVLDTCMGLGYTAMEAGSRQEVTAVYSCEIDWNVYQMARENPWSFPLFNHPKIHLTIADISEFIQSFPQKYFQVIIHDPPRFTLAPQLYSWEFYCQIYRVLKDNGELYHYTGNPNQTKRKRDLASKTSMLLQEAGFRKVCPAYAGVYARK